jgi:hypothetical protein
VINMRTVGSSSTIRSVRAGARVAALGGIKPPPLAREYGK